MKHKDPSNTELRNEYHETLKSYKLTLKTKQDTFHNNMIEKLEQASQQDSTTFWKTLKKSTDDLENGISQKTHQKQANGSHISNNCIVNTTLHKNKQILQ